MQILKTFFLAFILFMINSYVYAQQYSLKGRIIGDDQKPLEFITAVLKKDSIVVQKAITDNNGKFSFKTEKGHYLLQLEQFGRKLMNLPIEVKADTDLADLSINRTVMLNSVTVTAHKELIERKVDRLVINVENLPSAQGTDAIGVLQNTPMVNADESSGIAIVGKGAVSIMVNDRIIYLSGNELTTYLRSIRSENISRVEVITTPPAKYDAQGNSGIINIILKKNPNLGWNGNHTSSLTKGIKGGFSNNFNLNYQNTKVRSSLNLKQSYNSVEATGYSNIIGLNSQLSNYTSLNKTALYGGSYSLDYAADRSTDIGFYVDYTRSSPRRNAIYDLQYETQSRLDSMLNTNSVQQVSTDILQANLYLGRQLKGKGRKIELNGNFLTTNPTTGVDFTTTDVTDGDISRVLTDNRLTYRVFSGQLDFTLPYNKIYLETGGKFTRFLNNSSLRYYNLNDMTPVFIPENSDDFAYRESNIAGYVSASATLGKKWSGKAGVRYEYSIINGYSPAAGTVTDNRYGKFFPTFYLTYTPDSKKSFYLNFSKRINRPNFSALNPFRNYSNPYIYYTGNPSLQPSYSYNLELGYSRNRLNLSLYASTWNNGNAYVTRYQNGIQINIQENYIDQKSVGTSLFYNGNPFKVWEVTPSASLSYMSSATALENTIPKSGLSASLNVNNVLYLNTSKTFLLLINYNYFFGNYSGNIRNYSRGNLYTGLRFGLLKRKAQLNVGVNDILKQQYSRGTTYYTTFHQEYKNYVDVRRLNVSLTYAFGNSKVKASNRNLKFEDKTRAN